MTTAPDDPPIACSLEPDAMPDRLRVWASVLERARARTTASDGARRIEFAGDIDVGELARLVVAEQHCCAFFSFAITVDARGVGLEVRVPDGATAIVSTLFGQPA